MELMKRWQLKMSAREQLRGQWGNMALRSFLITAIPLGVLWAVMLLLSLLTIFGHVTISFVAPFQIGARITTIVLLIFFLAFYIAIVIVMVALEFGFIDGLMKLRCGMDSSLSTLFGKFNMLPKILMLFLLALIPSVPYVSATVLMELYPGPVAAILVILSFVVLCYVTIRASMCTYILIENPYTTTWTAVKQSWYMMKGHCWRYFVLMLSFYGWMLLAALSFGIGMFWLMPYMNLTSVNFYYDLKQYCFSEQ